MHVDHSLQHGLACLGYSVGEYRQLSGNRLESDNLRPGVKKRPDRLVSPAELEEIIDNSCAQYFLFALSAKLGRATCRERVCQYVSISLGSVSLKKNNTNT